MADVRGATASQRSDVLAAVTAAWTSATASDTALSLSITGMSTIGLTLNPTSTFTAGTLNFEVSDDGGTTWYAMALRRVDSGVTETVYAIVASQKIAWQSDVGGYTDFRVRLNPAITGTGTANLRLQASAALASNLDVGTEKYAAVAAASSGDNTVAVTGKKIRVRRAALIAAAANNIYFTSGAGGTVVFGGSTNKIGLAANGGFVLPDSPGWFETAAGAALIMNLSAASSVAGGIAYQEV
jgi:hypothetical protein